MRRAMLATLCLAACGGSPSASTDYAAQYVAAWTAQISIQAQGSSSADQILLPIQEREANVIELQGFCSETNPYSEGLVADVTANGYTVRPDACSIASATCPSGGVGFAWARGDGTLDNGQLTGEMSGTLSCGSVSVNFTASFTSSQRGAYGGFTAQGGSSLGRAFVSLQE